MNQKKIMFLWIGTGLALLSSLFSRALFPDLLWLTVALLIVLVACLVGLIVENRKAMRKRTVAFGAEAISIVILVIGIVGVLNFFAAKYPKKLDLTQNKINTLSDQTEKLVKTLKAPLKAVYFSKGGQREKAGVLLDNLKGINPKFFDVEYIDPDKEPTRAKQVGVKKYDTLQLIYNAGPEKVKEQKIEDPTEEKLTNALIKLLKEQSQIVCAVTGHGEKDFSSGEAEGYDAAKKAMSEESYELRELNLMQEGKVPADCAAVVVVGPSRSFFAPEVKVLSEYLKAGGRAFIALDLNMKGTEFSPELLPVLKEWFVEIQTALIVDPLSKMLGVDAAVPIIANFAKDHPITRDIATNAYFPFARPLELMKGAPAEMKAKWLTQTTPKSWAEGNMKELTTGKVQFTEGVDKNGPLTTGVAIEMNKTRLVVFGTALFATNNYSRFGSNQDIFLNSINWLMEDENQISIRSKEDAPGKLELSNRAANTIFLITVVVIPFLTAVAGIVIWFIRRRL